MPKAKASNQFNIDIEARRVREQIRVVNLVVFPDNDEN